MPMSMRQRLAVWLDDNLMPTFASLVYRDHEYRLYCPKFIDSPRKDYEVKVGPVDHQSIVLPDNLDVES